MQYGRSRWGTMAALLRQAGRMLSIIGEEHRWLQTFVKDEGINGIISDNRYGLHHPAIPSVIITHQPAIITGFGKSADTMIRRLHYRYLQPFGQCWIPDLEGPLNLAGNLSHPRKLP